MPNYATLNGKPTTADDPKRGLWYSVQCTFWTDDWGKLSRVGPGIPCCPHCQSLGYEAEAGEWLRSAADFQDTEAPGYLAFLEQNKERCQGMGRTFGQAWAKHKASQD